MQPTKVLDANGQQVGTYQRSVDTPDGALLLIAREERFGGTPFRSAPDSRSESGCEAPGLIRPKIEKKIHPQVDVHNPARH